MGIVGYKGLELGYQQQKTRVHKCLPAGTLAIENGPLVDLPFKDCDFQEGISHEYPIKSL